MKIKELIANLQKLTKDRPELLDAKAIYSKDDEGVEGDLSVCVN